MDTTWPFMLLASLLAMTFAVFLALREFWTWYWKQSQQVRLQTEILATLRRLEAQQAPPTGVAPVPAAVPTGTAARSTWPPVGARDEAL